MADSSPLCFQVVVEEGISTLGMKPSCLPPDPVIISHVDENSWAQLNGVSVGDELVQVNGVKVTEISVVMLDNFLRKMRPLLLTFLSGDSRRGWARRAASPLLSARSVSPRPACEKAVQAQVESRSHPSPSCSCSVHTAEDLAQARLLAAQHSVEPVATVFPATSSKAASPEQSLAAIPQLLQPLDSECKDSSDTDDGGGVAIRDLGLSRGSDLGVSRGSTGTADPLEEELLQRLVGTWVYSKFEYEISRLHSRRVLFEQVQFDERDPASAVRVSGILRPRGPWLQGEILDKDKVRLGSMRVQWREENDTAISSVMLVHEDEWGTELVARRKQDAEASSMLNQGRVVTPAAGYTGAAIAEALKH